MKLADSIRLFADAAGTQATVPDSPQTDNRVKKLLDEKQKRLNDMRQELTRTLDPAVQGLRAAYNVYKDTANQHPGRMAEGGRFAVTDPEGLIVSTHPTLEKARRAAMAMPDAKWVDLGADEVFRARYLNKKPPKGVQLADALREGDRRPSSHGQGAAGTGGAAGPGGGQ